MLNNVSKDNKFKLLVAAVFTLNLMMHVLAYYYAGGTLN